MHRIGVVGRQAETNQLALVIEDRLARVLISKDNQWPASHARNNWGMQTHHPPPRRRLRAAIREVSIHGGFGHAHPAPFPPCIRNPATQSNKQMGTGAVPSSLLSIGAAALLLLVLLLVRACMDGSTDPIDR